MKPTPLTLGVLGGMGPAAGAHFLQLLSAAVSAGADQEHPRVLMLSDPSVPDRTQAILDNNDAPLAPIRAGLHTLISWGADILAVPCNAAHFFIDRIIDELSVPLVHIVDLSLDEAVHRSPDGAWLAATTGTVMSGLYQRKAAGLGYRLVVPDHGAQAQIDRAALMVKANQMAASARQVTGAMTDLWVKEEILVLAACTELPIAYEAAGLPASMSISSSEALAFGCAAELHQRNGRMRRGELRTWSRA